MAVIVDTSVWIQFLRTRESPEYRELDRLLEEGNALLVGVVMAEVLQGARSPQEFEELRSRFTQLPYVTETKDTWTRVGALAYQLRQQGQRIGIVDLLIASLALEHGHQLYTLDDHFQRVPGLRLYSR